VDEVPFGRYRLVELLGRGGMGEVWRAHDTATNRAVAIKLLPPHLAQDDTFVQRFRREAEAAARLNSPHIIPIHDYGEIEGRLFVNMRLIEGHDLQEVLTGGPLEPARAVRIIDQVAKALHAAHKIGLVHRDVKPSNILLDEDDFAYLIDFGIARALDETRLTSTGYTIGTFQYIAPERLGTRAEEDARADIYSLACVLYECLTGRPPFAGDTMAGLVAAHLNTPPPRPSTSQPNIPKQVDQVIATGMAKDPEQRYATTVELANAAHDAITTPLAPLSEPTLLDNTAPPAPRHAAQQQPADLHLAATRQRTPGWPPVPQPRPPDRRTPDTGTPPQQPWRRRQRREVKWAIIAAIVVILAAAGITGYHLSAHPASGQTVLPFAGLNHPFGVALDTAGTVYVADADNNRVVKLAAGASAQTVLPFVRGDLISAGLYHPNGVAVDTAGGVYVTDADQNRVVKLAVGASTQTELPFAGLHYPFGVAVDTAGTVYVADGDNDRVVKLAAGASAQTVLPFAGLHQPYGVAVDAAGNIYVTDLNNNRVLKLPAQ